MLKVRLLGEFSPSAQIQVSQVGSGLEFCGVKCIGNAVLGVAKDAYELGGDAFDTALRHLPGPIRDAVNAVKHGVFDGWAAWVRLHGAIGKALVNGFNAVYDGVIELGKQAWVVLTEACRLFREYKDYINIGIQVIQGDYANAAANLAEEAAAAMGVPSPVSGTDSEIVQIAEFVCGAVDGINLVSAIAEGIPAPPPLAPSTTLIVENGVARPRTAVENLRLRHSIMSVALINPRVRAIARNPNPIAPKKSLAPTVIVGASAVAALILLSR